jgi:hypothetical protein
VYVVQVLESPRWPGPGFAEPGDDAQRVCQLMEAAIAAAFAVPVDELRSHSRRTQSVAFARQSAMYLAHVVLGLNYRDAGLLFRRDRTTAAYACQVVEDRRDDPAIDRLLQQLEGVCNDLARDAGAFPGEVGTGSPSGNATRQSRADFEVQ